MRWRRPGRGACEGGEVARIIGVARAAMQRGDGRRIKPHGRHARDGDRGAGILHQCRGQADPRRILRHHRRAGQQQAARHAIADQPGQPCGAQHQPKGGAGEGEARPRQRQAVVADGEQIRPRAEDAPARHRQRRHRQGVDPLQQQLDADDAQRQVALARNLQVRQVEAGAEIAPAPAQHDQPRAIGQHAVQRFVQRRDQIIPQRIAAIGAREPERRDAIRRFDVQHGQPAMRQQFGSMSLP